MEPVSLDNLRILVVDDEPGALENLVDIFEDRHCHVTTAATGQQALDAVRRDEFDVALLDIRLPDIPGTDLLREIRRISDNTRCIMVTASTDMEDAISALNDGASAYIKKPIDIPNMLEKILEVVAKYRKTVEERRKLQDLNTVKNVGEAAMDLDLGRMLDNVLRQVVEGFHAEAGAILLRQPGERTLRGAADLDFSEEPIRNYVAKIGEGFAGRVAWTNRVLVVEDLTSVGYGISPMLQGAHIASLIGAPIQSPKGLVGVLLVGWREPRAFTAADTDLLGVVAQRIGLAAVNAMLYHQEDLSKQRAEFLAQVSQELNSLIGDERQVVERITRRATERLGDGCAIFIKRPDSGVLDAVLSYHTDPEKQRFLEERLFGNPVRLGEGTVGEVAVSGSATIIRSEDILAAYPDRPYLLQTGIRASMAVPLRAHGEIIGVMSCSTSEPDRDYSPQDLALAEEFADRAAVAIENAHLLKESQEKRQELQSLFEMTRVVTGTLQESEVLEALLRGTSELIDTPAGCIATYNPERDSLSVNAEVGISEEMAAEIASACFVACRDGMSQEDTPFFIEDLQAVPDARLKEIACRAGLRSLLSVPLSKEGGMEGLLMTFTHQPDPDLGNRRQLLATLGGLASVAITNARSFEREQKIAERLQQWILSTDANVRLEGLQVAMDYHAALTEANVGGDFFDIFNVGPDQFGVVIGDVSGKGLEAALHTQAVKHTLRAYALAAGAIPSEDGDIAPIPNSPREVITRTNDAVCFMLPNDIFITLFYAVVDVRDRSVRYVNAGHDAPILCHGDDRCEMLESTGRALGLMAGAKYEEVHLKLEPADILLLYTDGVTEARHGRQFLETDGVIQLVKKHAQDSAEGLVKGIYRDVKRFAEGYLHDDIALLALKVPGGRKG